MTWKESLEWQVKEKEFLDTKDLTQFIIKDKNIFDIMDNIEEAFGKEYSKEPYIFNCLSSSEFMEYLTQRYDIKFYEYTENRVL